MPFFAFLMFAALTLYSIAIWSEKFVKKLEPWMVIVFITAFVCDFSGTSIMWFISTSNTLNIHAICGYSGLVIMLLHLLWAIVALKRRGRAQALFSRYSVYAWATWMAAFITGVPKA